MKKKVFSGLVLLLLLVIAAAWWLTTSSPGLYSDPAKPRQNTQYTNLLKTYLEIPSIPPDPITNAIISTNGNEIVVSIKDQSIGTNKIKVPVTLHRAGTSNRVSIANGSVVFEMLQTGWIVPTTNFPYSIQFPGNYYLPTTLEKLDPKKLLPQYKNQLQFEGDFPTAQLYFLKTNLTDFKIIGYTAFDARTKFTLTTSYSSAISENSWWFRGSVPIWHQTPLEIATTIATGPCIFYEAAPTIGTEIRHDSGLVKFLGAIDQGINGWSSSSSSGSETLRLTVDPTQSSGQNPECTLIFYIFPEAVYLPFDIEALDATGKSINSLGNSFGGKMLTTKFAGYSKDIKQLRLKIYPNIHRIIWTLPELPGLPEENRGIANLFNVKIPYMRFRYEGEYQTALRKLVQMDMNYLPLTYPNGYFPTYRTNFTAKDLFTEIESKIPPTPPFANRILIADSQKNKIELKPPLWQQLIEKAKKLVGFK